MDQPSPASINTITIRNSSNVPLANVLVWVEVAPEIDVCASAAMAGFTDQAGQARPSHPPVSFPTADAIGGCHLGGP
jgi:hypothetical protein